MSSQQAIFSSIKLGKNQLQHRVVLALLTRFRATAEHVPTDLQAKYYKQRTSNGSLLITEATDITFLGGGYPNVPGWKKVTAGVHEKDGVIFLQIWHVGRAASNAAIGQQVVYASPIAIPGKNPGGQDYDPRALENAIEAGFDGVELRGANSFLLDQFINSNSNNRTDQYGGSTGNRVRFSLEVVDAVANTIGAHRTAIRFSPGATFQDMGDDTPIQTWGYLATQLQKIQPDLAYLHFIEIRADVFDENCVNTADIPYLVVA